MLVATFIRNALKDETISEFKLKPTTMINELIAFSQNFKDDEDDANIIEKLSVVLKSKTVSEDDIAVIEKEVERVLKMFYLHMRVKGHIKAFKDDYFV